MTVDTQTTKVQYQGNGAAKVFAVPFKVIEAAHLKLFLYENGRESEISTGFAVTGIESSSAGVVLDAPLPAGAKLTIMREVPLVQPTDLQNGGDFNADVLETSLDYLEMQIQQNAEGIERAVKLIVSSSETSDEYADEIFQAHGETLQAAGRADAAAKSAETSANLASASARLAWEDAERAAALVDPASLSSGVFNVRKPFVLETAVQAGSVMALPGFYFPGRDVLWLSFDGVVCTPRKSGVELPGEFQYSEIGDDPDQASNQVVIYFDAPSGSVFDLWVVSSAVGANIDEIARLAGQSALDAGQAGAAASTALALAERAEVAAGQAVDVVDEAVLLATGEARAQADRAEAEADRAFLMTEQLPDVTLALDGQVLVARNVGGNMQAGYENAPSASSSRLEVTLPTGLAAGEAFAVPRYIVGAAKLQVFYEGVLCKAGPAEMYQELGTSGTQSVSIIFNEPLPAGADITAIAAN